MENSTRKPQGIWLEVKGDDEGESLLVNVAAIGAIEEVQGGYNVHIGSLVFKVTREQESLLWELIRKRTDFDQILRLKKLEEDMSRLER